MVDIFRKHREVVEGIASLSEEEKELLYSALNIHGHFCGGMPMGYLAGLAGLRALGVERERDMDKVVIIYVGTQHAGGCFADGVQFSTGCTFGKGIMVKKPLGKWSFTLCDAKTRRAVRVTVRPEILKHAFNAPFIREYRFKGIPPTQVDQEVSLKAFLGLFSKPLNEIVAVKGPFEYLLEREKSSFNLSFCEVCGDAVAENYLRIEDGKHVCLDCFSYKGL